MVKSCEGCYMNDRIKERESVGKWVPPDILWKRSTYCKQQKVNEKNMWQKIRIWEAQGHFCGVLNQQVTLEGLL